ncbi:class I SAM-dependent methyltransferase [Bizionia arctica]|uniref:Methyltransferase n=1 Tax=Bizionia arctica TaxID=1495645 RepID=A0A917GBW8_9FLAO|nr:class I SAM-dependent methyltransferase [Bizionia arctica]GGG36797.1 methyltransferase [Bizionia arctica]
MKQLKPYLTVKDHSVSGEEFQLIENETYGFLETVPQPTEVKLPEYYKTEDYISHTDSQRNLFEKVYHIVRDISLKRKLKLINSFSSNKKRLLDIGCGTGDFLQTAQKNQWEVSGIEPNKQAREIANKKTNQAVFDIDQLEKFEENSFDVITLWHVLEHLPNLENQISVLKKLLKAEGTLIIAVPNYKSYDASYYKNYWAAFDVPRHLWHFSKKSISNLFLKEQMEVVKTLPMTFDSYYVSMLSEKYRKGTLSIFNGFRVGWLSNMKAKSSGEYSSLIYVIKNS